MKQLGEDNDLDLPEEENQAQISAFEPVTTFLDNKSNKEIEEVKQKYKLQISNIERMQKLIFEYSLTHKLKSPASLKILEQLKCGEGEKCWPTANELSVLSCEQLKELQVCTLRIIQKNS